MGEGNIWHVLSVYQYLLYINIYDLLRSILIIPGEHRAVLVLENAHIHI